MTAQNALMDSMESTIGYVFTHWILLQEADRVIEYQHQATPNQRKMVHLSIHLLVQRNMNLARSHISAQNCTNVALSMKTS
jgi:hypothetical protein